MQETNKGDRGKRQSIWTNGEFSIWRLQGLLRGSDVMEITRQTY